MSSYETISDLDFFDSCVEDLIEERFLLSIGEDPDINISRGDIKKSAWVASYLANSQDSSHRKKP